MLSVSPVPASASPDATWASSNPSVAIVSGSSLVTGVAVGSATITATSTVNSAIKATINVTVVADVRTRYIKITSEAELYFGATCVIANHSENGMFAMKHESGTSNIPAFETFVDDGKLVDDEDVMKVELGVGIVKGTYTFEAITRSAVDNGKFLYAAGGGSSNNNHLRLEETASANASWKITYEDGVAEVIAQGNENRSVMRFNSSSSLFSAFGSGQDDVELYLD